MFTPATSVQEFPASITLLTFTFPLLLLPVWSNATMLKTILYFSPPSLTDFLSNLVKTYSI